ncbi:DUF6230 family protein [Kyrpidia spormannii]|uniref:Uncharacterized protein n=2 Tax=Kyrpidia spormannii TaxID=2055160 RepID=A0ACA8ZA98_9BACL|nr:DUF6230 family protein [Kyrpidia spormannii]CAB3393371.1 conserved protein of unknown function [Kyrpidia spormannii]CAB3394292.1 conserved protein of unknown function [Kyrpidia spormannii]
MGYRWKWFLYSMSGALALLFALVFGIWKGGVALAVPVAGIGSFYIEADQIDVTNFKLLPKIGESSESSVVPQGASTLDATIKGMKLYKDVDMPGKGRVRVLITAAGDVKASGLTLDLSRLSSDGSFTQLEVAEHNDTDPTKKFSMGASSIVLNKPVIEGHYLFANSISLPGMVMQFELNPSQ